MYVELKDKDTFSSDEIIGVCQINLNEIPPGSVSAKWYQLFYNQKSAGEVLIEIIYTPDHVQTVKTIITDTHEHHNHPHMGVVEIGTGGHGGHGHGKKHKKEKRKDRSRSHSRSSSGSDD